MKRLIALKTTFSSQRERLKYSKKLFLAYRLMIIVMEEVNPLITCQLPYFFSTLYAAQQPAGIHESAQVLRATVNGHTLFLFPVRSARKSLLPYSASHGNFPLKGHWKSW